MALCDRYKEVSLYSVTSNSFGTSHFVSFIERLSSLWMLNVYTSIIQNVSFMEKFFSFAQGVHYLRFYCVYFMQCHMEMYGENYAQATLLRMD